MGYLWQQESEREGASQAERIPAGTHEVRISKIIHGTRQGPFQSRDGDPQIMLVFQDRQAREASLFVTLSEKAAWVLAKVMACCSPPVNLARMQADGVEPERFSDPEFADANLLDRQLVIQVEWPDGAKYPEVTPVKPRSASASPSPSTDDPPPSPSNDPPPSTEDDPPPSTEDELTRDDAWRRVLENWSGACRQDATGKQRRNEAWLKAIREVGDKAGRTEQQFTSADWSKVVEICAVPF